jgi:hypothetical protein
MRIFLGLFSPRQKKGQTFVWSFFQAFKVNYSENVNGIVTVVLPDFTLLKVQRLTAFLTSVSNSLKPVVEETVEMLMISPPGAIVNFKVTLPWNPGFFFRHLL